MDPAIVMCKNSGHGKDGEKIMELGTMDMDGSTTEKMDNGDDEREGDEGTRLKIKVLQPSLWPPDSPSGGDPARKCSMLAIEFEYSEVKMRQI
ncbi:hypothetical protein Tco_0509519 [Tanacetum coccineum]